MEIGDDWKFSSILLIVIGSLFAVLPPTMSAPHARAGGISEEQYRKGDKLGLIVRTTLKA